MTSDEGWLAAMWPFVRAWLPSAPARVLEIGCGPLGGFVPALSRGGYDAVGVDPEAPEGPGYHRVQFERYQSPQPVDCVVACTSLHHVGDHMRDCTPAGRSPGRWMRGSTGGCGPMGRTSSPTFSTPPRQTNRPRSMPGRSIQTTGIRYAGTRR